MKDPKGFRLNRSQWKAQHQLGHRIVTYRFNANHLRGGPIDHNKFKILLLGDSYTFGWLLEENETLAAKWQSYADRCVGPGVVQFLNGGTGGWGTASYLAFLEQYGAGISPSIVLVVLNTDDIGRSFKSQIYKINEEGKLEMSDRKSESQTVKNVANALPFYPYLLEHSHFIQFSRSLYLTLQSPTQSMGEHSAALMQKVPSSPALNAGEKKYKTLGRALFKRMKSWCESHNCALIVLTTGFHPLALSDDPTSYFMDVANNVFSDLDIGFHDISPEFTKVLSNNFDNVRIPIDGHPNEKGSDLIAKLNWPFLWLQLKDKIPRASEAHLTCQERAGKDLQ